MGKRRTAPDQRPVLPGEAVMLGTLSTKRCTALVQTRRTAWITFKFKSSRTHEHVALVRDISDKGIFFYSDFLPTLGDQLDFVVEYLNGPAQARLHFKGAVVRVRKANQGALPE